MITQVLNQFSSGELSNLIRPDIISEYERLIGKTIEKDDLVRAITTLYGSELVSMKEKREKLIDRMSQNQVDTLVEKLLSDSGISIDLAEISNDKYKLLSWLSERLTVEFLSLLGFPAGAEGNEALQRSVSGVLAIEPSYPMYPYQQKMVGKVKSIFQAGEDCRCLLHLPTGAGKTRTAMNVASEHLRVNGRGLVLWLADTSELCAQAASEFETAWRSLGNKTIKMYSYFSDTNISLGGLESGFLVAGLQKLKAASGSSDYRILYEKLRENVSLIIFDEAHKAIAPTYSKIIEDMISRNKNTPLIGLSATPGRSLDIGSDEDEKLSQFFYGNKVTMQVAGYESPIKFLVDNQYLANAEFINIDYNSKKIGLMDDFSTQKGSAQIRKALSEDESRNLRLIEVIENEYNKGGSIIVFACSVAHSQSLASFLAFSGIEAYSLDSSNDDVQSRRRKIKNYKFGNVRVLVNFNILTAGFDAPKTNVVVIARPTDSLVQYSQMAGRAMRGTRSGGNDRCKVYTVRDDIPAFTSVVQAFSHWDRLWSEV